MRVSAKMRPQRRQNLCVHMQQSARLTTIMASAAAPWTMPRPSADATRAIALVVGVLIISLVAGSARAEAVTGPARFGTNVKSLVRFTKFHASEATARAGRRSPAAASAALMHATYGIAYANALRAILGAEAFAKMAKVNPGTFATHLERIQDASARRMRAACPSIGLSAVPVTPGSVLA
jgi:hypothetical protein